MHKRKLFERLEKIQGKVHHVKNNKSNNEQFFVVKLNSVLCSLKEGNWFYFHEKRDLPLPLSVISNLLAIILTVWCKWKWFMITIHEEVLQEIWMKYGKKKKKKKKSGKS